VKLLALLAQGRDQVFHRFAGLGSHRFNPLYAA
jgi:hypothetical protein